MYTCKSIGCRLSFKYREQLRRHYLKCEKPKVEKKLEFEMVDGKFQCVQCNKKYQYKEGYYRHLNNSCKQKVEHKCEICEKVFSYKSRLPVHKVTHTKAVVKKQKQKNSPCNNSSIPDDEYLPLQHHIM